MHITKVKLSGGDYTRLADHMERKHKFYKSDVDQTKSNQNIILKAYERDLEGFIRAQGVKRVRKDSVGALNLVCTVADGDKDYLHEHPEEYTRWASTVIRSTLRTFGLKKDDILGAVIHLDEDKSNKVSGGNAHLQLSLAPLVREKDRVRLSAKEITTKKAFKSLHDDLQKAMERQGFKGQYVSKDKEARGLGKETLEEYKKSMEVNKNLRKEKEELQRSVRSLKQSRTALQENLKTLKAINSDLKDKNEQFQKDYFELLDENLNLKSFVGRYNIQGKPMIEAFEQQYGPTKERSIGYGDDDIR
jgi:hypothetical protein